jgi:uncharacterized protein YggT (Ycf19 family)
MTTFLIILYRFLSVIDFCMLALAICSFIPSARETKIYAFFYRITDPILRPVRNLFMRWDFARRCPLDLSFLAVVILISVVQRFILMIL